MELLAQFDEAERAGDVDKLAFCVRSLIVQAASIRAVGMSARARCVKHMYEIKHMYENAEYILMDGEKRAWVHPTNGVKQGCPLSPLLFSLYINDMGREISEGIEGAVTGDRVNCVSTCCMLMTLD